MTPTMLQLFGPPPPGGWQICLVAALCGVFSHLLHYMNSNHEPQSAAIAISHFLLLPAISMAVATSRGLTVASLLGSIELWISFHLGLVVSMILYRVLFHPLRRIPGPCWAKITKIPIMVVARRGKLHELHTEWAEEYGPIVRIG